jgi:hypothetical protein
MKMCCTKKFLSELKRNPAKEEPEKDSFWSWHANIFNIERRKCVLVTNDLTLFSLFIPGLKKPDVFELNHRLNNTRHASRSFDPECAPWRVTYLQEIY